MLLLPGTRSTWNANFNGKEEGHRCNGSHTESQTRAGAALSLAHDTAITECHHLAARSRRGQRTVATAVGVVVREYPLHSRCSSIWDILITREHMFQRDQTWNRSLHFRVPACEQANPTAGGWNLATLCCCVCRCNVDYGDVKGGRRRQGRRLDLKILVS